MEAQNTLAEASMVSVSLTNDDEEDDVHDRDRAKRSSDVRPYSTLDECRICRSSALELLEAEADEARRRAGGSVACDSCCCLRRPPHRPPLHRLRCACAGSVRHVCSRCYQRYYVARGLVNCEICRQPTGLEGEAFDSGGSDRGCAVVCRRLRTFCCSDEVRYCVYAIFILVAFFTAFALFFVFSATEDQKARSSTPPPRLESQWQTERLVFAGIALVNLGFAVAYIGYSYWRYQRGHSHRCCCWWCGAASHLHGVELLATVGPVAVTTHALQQQPQLH